MCPSTRSSSSIIQDDLRAPDRGTTAEGTVPEDLGEPLKRRARRDGYDPVAEPAALVALMQKRRDAEPKEDLVDLDSERVR